MHVQTAVRVGVCGLQLYVYSVCVQPSLLSHLFYSPFQCTYRLQVSISDFVDKLYLFYPLLKLPIMLVILALLMKLKMCKIALTTRQSDQVVFVVASRSHLCLLFSFTSDIFFSPLFFPVVAAWFGTPGGGKLLEISDLFVVNLVLGILINNQHCRRS